MTAPAQDAPKTAKGEPARQFRPFVVGSREVDVSTYDETKTMGTSATKFRPYQLDPIGYAAALYIDVQAVADNAGAAVVAYTADGALAAFDTIAFKDINNKEIGGPMTSHDWYEVIKHGGYMFSEDIKASSATYTATTGNGATGGSWSWVLRLPIEIIHRNALGAQTNKNSGALLSVELTLAPRATVYSTPPSGAVTVQVQISLFGWMDASQTDGRQNPVRKTPPALDTMQFWTKQTYPINAGNQVTRLTSLDGPLRNLFLQARDAVTGSRQTGDTSFPDQTTILYERVQPVNRRKRIWRRLIEEWFDYTNAPDTAKGRSYGLYPLPFNRDFGLRPGAENCFTYLPVSTQTNITVQGQWGAAVTLAVFANKVYPASGNPMALTGGR